MSPLSASMVATIYDYDFAIDLYNQIIIKDPRSASAYNNRGICTIKKAMDRYDVPSVHQGIRDIETAILLWPEEHYSKKLQSINALAWAKNVIEVLETMTAC